MQIELLSPKQNGNAVDDRDGATKQHSKQTIKSMWKKAFKSLKSKDKDKDRDKDRDREWDREREKDREREREKDDRSEKFETSSRYSKVSHINFLVTLVLEIKLLF